jgi:hypothetical protein
MVDMNISFQNLVKESQSDDYSGSDIWVCVPTGLITGRLVSPVTAKKFLEDAFNPSNLETDSVEQYFREIEHKLLSEDIRLGEPISDETLEIDANIINATHYVEDVAISLQFVKVIPSHVSAWGIGKLTMK